MKSKTVLLLIDSKTKMVKRYEGRTHTSTARIDDPAAPDLAAELESFRVQGPAYQMDDEPKGRA